MCKTRLDRQILDDSMPHGGRKEEIILKILVNWEYKSVSLQFISMLVRKIVLSFCFITYFAPVCLYFSGSVSFN